MKYFSKNQIENLPRIYRLNLIDKEIILDNFLKNKFQSLDKN